MPKRKSKRKSRQKKRGRSPKRKHRRKSSRQKRRRKSKRKSRRNSSRQKRGRSPKRKSRRKSSRQKRGRSPKRKSRRKSSRQRYAMFGDVPLWRPGRAGKVAAEAHLQRQKNASEESIAHRAGGGDGCTPRGFILLKNGEIQKNRGQKGVALLSCFNEHETRSVRTLEKLKMLFYKHAFNLYRWEGGVHESNEQIKKLCKRGENASPERRLRGLCYLDRTDGEKIEKFSKVVWVQRNRGDRRWPAIIAIRTSEKVSGKRCSPDVKTLMASQTAWAQMLVLFRFCGDPALYKDNKHVKLLNLKDTYWTQFGGKSLHELIYGAGAKSALKKPGVRKVLSTHGGDVRFAKCLPGRRAGERPPGGGKPPCVNRHGEAVIREKCLHLVPQLDARRKLAERRAWRQGGRGRFTWHDPIDPLRTAAGSEPPAVDVGCPHSVLGREIRASLLSQRPPGRNRLYAGKGMFDDDPDL